MHSAPKTNIDKTRVETANMDSLSAMLNKDTKKKTLMTNIEYSN